MGLEEVTQDRGIGRLSSFSVLGIAGIDCPPPMTALSAEGTMLDSGL